MRNLLTLLLTYEILLAGLEILRNIIGWGRKWLVDFSIGKIQIVSFDLSNNCSIIVIKMVFSDIYILKCWVCLSVLNWIGALNIDSITISDSKKNWVFVSSMNNIPSEAALYLCKYSTRLCIEYFCHVWAGAPNRYLDTLDKIQKQKWRITGPTNAVTLELLADFITLIDFNLNWLHWFHFLVLVRGPLFIVIVCMSFLSPILDVIRICVNKFFSHRARLWNSLLAECYSFTYDLELTTTCYR